MRRMMVAPILLSAMLATSSAWAMAGNELPAGGGPLDNWVVVGPFPSLPLPELAEDGSGRSGWNIDYLESVGGETAPRIEVGVPIVVESEKGTITVTPRLAHPGVYSIFDMLEGLAITEADGVHAIAYAFATVTVPRGGEHFILLGADDAAKVYFNGELAFSEWNHGQGVTPGQYRFTHELKEGENTVLIKLDNNSGPWGFSFEMSHIDDKDLLMSRLLTGPEEFSRFTFGDHPDLSEALSRYNWHFFFNRFGNFHTLFVREYMTMADVWKANAFERGKGRTIQEMIRGWWASTWQDPDGYIQTHQHFSHSHDGGWPFPLWPQIYGGWPGYTAGWHFQDSGPGWVWDLGMVQRNTPQTGDMAADSWRVDGVTSHGTSRRFWRLTLDEPDAMLTSPAETVIDAWNAPFIQIRWRRQGNPPLGATPFIEWKRADDPDWSPDRRMLIFDYQSEFAQQTGFRHSIIPLHRHPEWNGTISAFRLVLAPGETGVEVEIDSIFTCYDTRKPYNNLFFVTGAWEYFRWTGDVAFLHEEINRLRSALRYVQQEFSTRELGHIRNQWFGHDGLAGWYVDDNGNRIPRPGHGIGNNYYDLLPFGWDDMYNTAQYYHALHSMAAIEELVLRNPGWALPEGGLAFDPEDLREHAARVKRVANEKFWNPGTGRFFGSFDRKGRGYDFGFTFVTLEAIFYGIANEENAREAMDWISGRRIVDGDTSTGEDIYHFRFGPRATTLRNIEWYGQGWTHPEGLEFGGQIQDGGAVLGMTFYDLYARLRTYGPDNAWERLKEILEWDMEVQAAGGYRAYYEEKGVTLQGGRTAGGIGIDFEFLESSLPPYFVLIGFLGLQPKGDRLHISPSIPSDLPSVGVTSIAYQGVVIDVTASHDSVEIIVHGDPVHPLTISFDEVRTSAGTSGRSFKIDESGTYVYTIVE